LGATWRETGGEDAVEGSSELRVEDGVDDGIKGGIGVTQPCQDLEFKEHHHWIPHYEHSSLLQNIPQSLPYLESGYRYTCFTERS